MTAATSDPSSSSLLTTKRQDLLALDARKKSLQSEAEAIVSELTAELPGGGAPMGIDSPLVDAEGFPRADIDVYRARSLRKQFKEIQTDLKALEKRMETGLLEIAALSPSSSNNNVVGSTTAKEDEEEKAARLAPKPKPKYDPKSGKWVVRSWDGSVAGVEHGERRSFDDLNSDSSAALASIGGGGGGSGQQHSASPSRPPQNHQQRVSLGEQQQRATPFAIVNGVAPGSPAHAAGLEEGDVLLRFGPVSSADRDGFDAIASLVPSAARERKSIPVSVRRTTTALGGLAEVIRTENLELRPCEWSGRGLLGCHILPHSE